LTPVPPARNHHGRRPVEATAEGVRALLESQGWRLATVAGRPCTGEDAQHDDGHFIVRDETNDDGSPTGTVALICFTRDYLFDLHSMSQQLEHAGYTSKESKLLDTLGIRAATSHEIEQRTAQHARNVGPLLVALLPDTSKQPPALPPVTGTTLF
jgi:hypothetical protein